MREIDSKASESIAAIRPVALVTGTAIARFGFLMADSQVNQVE